MTRRASERWLVGVDVGASETRLRVTSHVVDDIRSETSCPTVHVASGECDPAAVAELIRTALADGDLPPSAATAAIGIAGLPDLLTPDRVATPLAGLGLERFVVAADVVTAHVGAVGVRPGASVVAGTGVVGLATDLVAHWHRIDGWGYLLGDDGGGAWIGRSGLNAALRAADGRHRGSPRLLEAAVARFGALESIVPTLTARHDQAAALAAFAPDVFAAAAGHDAVAIDIVGSAAERLAEAFAATARALPGTTDVAYSGGLFAVGDLLLEPLRAHLAARSTADLTPAAGTPLDGALAFARLAADAPHQLPRHPLFIHSSGGQP